MNVFLSFFLFCFSVSAYSADSSDIRYSSAIFADTLNVNLDFIDSLKDYDLKMIFKEVRLERLVKKKDILKIKKEYPVFVKENETYIKRVLANVEDTSIIKYFTKIGYDLKTIHALKYSYGIGRTDSYKSIIKGFPNSELAVSVFKAHSNSFTNTEQIDFLIDNMNSKAFDEIYISAEKSKASEFVKALKDKDSIYVKNNIELNYDLFEKLKDKKLKIEYARYIPVEKMDKNLKYYYGKYLEKAGKLDSSALMYSESGDDEALLRSISMIKNLGKSDYADSILQNHETNSIDFKYHRAKLLISLKKNKSADSILEEIAETFPKTLYSIRSFIEVKKEFKIEKKENEEDTLISILHTLFVKNGAEKYFERYIARLIGSGRITNYDAAYIMNNLGKYNFGIYYAEKAVNDGCSYEKLITVLFPSPYIEIFKEAAEKNDVDICILLAIAREESGFNPDALSSAQAKGIMQLMDFVYKSYYKDDDYFDPRKNIMGGAKHISLYMKDFPYNPADGIMSYNAGKGNVMKWKRKYADWELFLESVPFIETKNYVKKVLRSYYIYKLLLKVS